MITITRRTMMAGTALVALAAGVGFHPALAAAPQVRNETSGATGSDLTALMAAANPGDVLIVSGRHVGQFTVPKPLTIRGDGSAVIDAGGTGTALVVAADDVTLEGLTLTGSGRTGTFRTIWGDAGLRLEGDRARVSGLDAIENDYGIVLLGGTGSAIDGCVIADNLLDGIKIMGGAGHSVERSQILRNRIGVYVDALYENGTLTEIVVPSFNDPASLERTAQIKLTSVYAKAHRIEANQVSGNEAYGIYLCWHTHHCTVRGNDVNRTGVTRPVTTDAVRYWQQALAMASGTEAPLDTAMLGSGIMLVCFPNNNQVTGNASQENLAYGMGADSTANLNLIEANHFEGNRVGLELEGAVDNTIRANVVMANSDFGIRIDVLDTAVPTAQPSSGNLILGNTMVANGVNAYDSSDRALSLADFEALIDVLPLPEVLRVQMATNPQIRRMMAEQMFGAHVPGHNRWDDGARGNHYGDFDEVAEGFRDADGDGVGEVAHAIPGGGQVDGHPLAAAPK